MRKSMFISAMLLCTLSVSIAQTLPAYVPTNGLVGWWPYNGNANDESNNGNNGTVYGAILTTDRFGVANKAYSFDGIDDYISNLLSMTATDSLTISLWYNSPVPNNISSTQFEMWESGNVTNQMHLNFSFNPISTGYLYTWITGIGQANDQVGTRTYNTWHHVVIIKEGNSETVYVDNITDFGQFTGISNTLQFDRFEVGREFTTGGNLNDTYYNGEIDDIGFWTRALDSSEVNMLFNGSTVGATEIYEGCNLILYPNPVNNYMNIIIPGVPNSQYTIYDLFGRNVLMGILETEKTRINVETLMPGIYFIYTNNYSQKFVKN